MKSMAASVWTFRDGLKSFIWMLSRMARAPLLRADPIMAKLLGSMGWRFLRACSFIAEEGLELWLRALPVLSLTPRCSAIRFAMLHVVIPTYAAEQRHV